MIRFLDLFAGIGGISRGFIDAGFDAVAAVVEDDYEHEIYKKVISPNFPLLYNVSEINISEIIDFDLLVTKISYSFSSRIPAYNSIHSKQIQQFLSIMQAKRPKAFLIETSLAFIRNDETKNHLSTLTNMGYNFSYTVLQTDQLTGLPVNEAKVFIVGFRFDLYSTPFQFPLTIASQIRPEEILNFHTSLPMSYYIKNKQINNMHEAKKNTLYVMQSNLLIRKDKIQFNTYNPTLLIDTYGLRQLTSNELAIFKGLGDVDFEVFYNKAKTKKALSVSSNVFVIRILANTISKYLGDTNETFDNLDTDYIYKKIYPSLRTSQKQEDHSLNRKADLLLLQKEKAKSNKDFPKHARRLKSIYIEKLKGLHDVEITFDKSLTAIMGINGSGKSTILHAIACAFKPISESNEKYMFPDFFLPNPDSSWKGSKFKICYSYKIKDKAFELNQISQKDSDRWLPRYNKRPDRNVYYIGISSCVPDIEAEKSKSFISYTTTYETDVMSLQIRDYANSILKKNYTQLTTHGTKSKKYIGVKISTSQYEKQSELELATTIENSSLIYSSLSMGSGEQRIMKILRIVLSAEKESLILIDEIDLLLHIDALKRLLSVLDNIAQSNKLQIVFTTHSLVMQELLDLVDIRFIQNLETKTIVHHNIYNDAILALTGNCPKPIRIFVEDKLARGIVNNILRELDMKSLVQVTMFGDARNAFTLASGEILRNADVSNILIIIDGDVYVSESEKKEQIEKVFSGTEINKKELRKNALILIKQFNLSGEKFPEKFIFNMLKSTLADYEDDNEIQKICRPMTSFDESHKYIDEIIRILGEDYDMGLRDILCSIQHLPEWDSYIDDIKSWLIEKKSALNSTHLK